jgi:hypothetical protein
MRPNEYTSRTPDYYLAKIEPTVLETLSSNQLDAVRQVLAEALPKPSPKLVDLRFVIDLIVDRFYVVLLVGKDRRQKRRQYIPAGIARIGNVITIAILFVSANLTISATIVLAVYLLKSAIGINLLPGHFTDLVKQTLGKG